MESFPAEIWQRFMEPALAGRPVREFPAPRQPVTFSTWERGPSSLSYDPYYVPPAPSTPQPKEPDETDDTETPADGETKPSGTDSPGSSEGDGGDAAGPPSSPGQPLDP